MKGYMKRLGALQESCGNFLCTLVIGPGDMYEAPEPLHSKDALTPVVAYVTEANPRKRSWQQVELLQRPPVGGLARVLAPHELEH